MTKYRTLTALRAAQLLQDIDNNDSDNLKLKRCKEALHEHVKAGLVRKERREEK